MQYISDMIILAGIYAVFFHKRWKKVERDISMICHLFYFYICLVFFVTLMPFRIPIPGIMGTNHLFWKRSNGYHFLI